LPVSTVSLEPGEFNVGIFPSDVQALPVELQPLYSLIRSNSSLFPPLYYQRILCKPAAGAVVLASPVMNGVNLKMPLFLVDRSNKSAAFSRTASGVCSS